MESTGKKLSFSLFRYSVFGFLFSNAQEQLNYFYSTNANINQLYSSKVKFPIFKSAVLDDNRDGKMDRLEMSFALPLDESEHIYGFNAMVYYQTKLSSRAKVMFDAVSLIGYESGTPITKLSIDGDVKLRQTYPFNVYGG
jgi:hypothetical protein